ncbi:MAG: ATP-dependent DNA helicase, partial [Acidimicrobiales bacterium]
VEALCGSGRAATVVVGVAGSGKTTALDAATTALEDAGYRLLGTSTSGQAARTLATEADIDASTFASLLWRLDHGSVTLDDRTVVLVDEAGMADDADLARLTLAVERARAGLVLVGDHRQLAAVGPGGGLAALLHRRPNLVVTLADNVRQRDPAERQALAQLRDGNVPAAVAWYANAGRMRTEPCRVDTLVAMTNSWATDVAAGHESALLAWRRADVADLNRLARDHWARLGRLRDDDITVTGGRTYAVGDRIVALAPNPAARIVTSEQLTITALTADRIDARTGGGRMVALTGTALDADHLDHAYALTVHRAQGATYERTHYLAAGGGRELAYVALSRARDRTVVYAIADDLAQAVDDLQADWGVERHQRWITETAARIGRHPEPVPAQVTSAWPETRVPLEVRRAETYRRLVALERDLADLCAGTGRWRHTPQGGTARHRNDAARRLNDAQRRANAPTAKRRDRRAAAQSLNVLTAALHQAGRRWQEIGQPIADRLRGDITRSHHDLNRLQLEALRRHLDALDRSSIGAPELPGHDRVRQHLDRLQGRDRGIGLGL